MSIVKVEINFDSKAAQVWDAITNIETMKKWYFDIPDFQLQVGTNFSFYESEKQEYLHQGEILKFENNKLLQHTWLHPNHSKGSSVVTWEIKELEENKVKVTLSHEGLENFADAGSDFSPENYEMGWKAIVKTNLRNYLYNIERIIFKQEINATVNNVWQKMWNKETYTNWTTPFCEGTYFTGELEMGNRIHFLTPKGDGMYSDVGYLIKDKLIIFSHIGSLANFKELPIDAETERWTGSFETYKFHEENGITTVTAEIDCVPEYIEFMKDKFPLALQELKKISE